MCVIHTRTHTHTHTHTHIHTHTHTCTHTRTHTQHMYNIRVANFGMLLTNPQIQPQFLQQKFPKTW